MPVPADSHEEVVLLDGTRVRLRLLRPDDKARLVEILDALSTHSRTMRFFVARTHISESELRYLTEIDGVNHYAILALCGEESVGVARFVRHAGAGDVAEPAVTIVDRLQARGLGGILFGRLIAAARERGVARFECEVLPANKPMIALLKGLGGRIPRRTTTWSESVTCTVDLGLAAVMRASQATKTLAPQRRVA